MGMLLDNVVLIGGTQVTTPVPEPSSLALVGGGIALFLLSLVITRYTFVGLRRYVQMNRSLLKGG